MNKKFVKYLPKGDLSPLQRRSRVKITSEPVSRPFAAACAVVSAVGIAVVLAGKLCKKR